MFGLPYIIFRPHNVYGEHQNIGDRYRNVIGIFMNQILQGERMTIFGDGMQQRAFSYIGDIAPIMARSPIVTAALNRVFNVGADQPYTIKYLADKVAEIMAVEPRVEHLPPRNEVYVAFSDHSACKEAFGSSPQTPLEEGLRRMAKWVKQVGTRSSREFKNVEVVQNLPPSWAAAGQ